MNSTCSSRIRCLSALATVLAAAVAGAGEYSARSYIQNGLVMHFDAIENVGYGVHDSTSPNWVNLVGSTADDNFSVLPLASSSWEGDCLNLTSGSTSADNRLITVGSVNLGSTFTFEVSGRSGSDGCFRRWEVYPWANTFETWWNNTEGYLERINGTRFAALKTALKNADLMFASTYSSGRHNAYAWKDDGTFYSATATGGSYSFNGRLSFFTSASTGTKARSIRVYNRVLSEDELKANNVIDQIRFFGKTPANVPLPMGWSFNAAGELLNTSSQVMIAPETPVAERMITDATFVSVDDAVQCTATIEAGTEGVTNALYVAWGASDCGASASAWPCIQRVRLVAPDVTSVTFDVPAAVAAFAQNVHVRLFLSETPWPYDYQISAVNAKNNQYLDSGYYANPLTYASLCFQLHDLTVQQRPFGADEDDTSNAFSFSTYINGAGQWAFSCCDGSGNWTAFGKTAYMEPVTYILDAATPRYTLITPTHGKYSNTFKSTRTRTATHTLCFFADKRKNDRIDLKVRDGDFFSALIAEGRSVLHAWTPCMVGGRAGLFDGISGMVHYSASGTDFNAAGTNMSLTVSAGDVIVSSCSAGLLPHGVYSVDTGTSPLLVDYALVYTQGGHKYGAAPLTLTGTDNDFGGSFTVHEGTLKASFGAGLAATDRLVLDGGLWACDTPMTASLGTTAGTVEIVEGSRAGFAAYGAANTVDLGGEGASLVYPSTGFAMSALLLNDTYSTHPITFGNAIAGDGTSPQLELSVGASQAVMAKNVTGVKLTKTGAGELLLNGAANAFATFTTAVGRTTVAPGPRTDLSFTGAVAVSDTAKLTCSNVSVTAGGAFKATQSAEVTLKDSDVEIAGNVNIGGDGSTQTRLVVDGGTLACSGTTTFGQLFSGWVKSSGDLVVTNNARLTLNKLSAGIGNVYQYSGSVTVTNVNSGDCSLGSIKDSTHNYYLYGGTFEFLGTQGNFQTGRATTNGTSNLYVERDGLLKTHCWSPSIGRTRFNTGKLYVRNGGRVVADYTGNSTLTFWISDEGSGYLEVASGGSMDIDGRLCCCPSGYTHAERAGEIRLLAGGTVTSRAVSCEAEAANHKNSTLIYDGGRVVVRTAPQTPFTRKFKSAQIGVAGGVIDTNGSDVRFEQNFAARSGQTWTAPTTAAAIDSCAAFTKAGAGTLTWLGTNTYACATCVSNGVLATACEGVLPSTGILKLAGGAVNLLATQQTVGELFGCGAVSNGTLTVTGAVWPGGVSGGTLELAGVTASLAKLHYAIDANGACGALRSTTPVDLAGVEISVDGLANKRNGRLLLVDAPSLTGTPTTDLPNTSRVFASGGKLYLGSYTGTAVYFR